MKQAGLTGDARGVIVGVVRRVAAPRFDVRRRSHPGLPFDDWSEHERHLRHHSQNRGGKAKAVV